MRLLKLLAYFTIGYAIYQFFQGMSDMESSGGSGGYGGYGRDLDRALNEDTGRAMNMTGPGRGTTVSTQDASGTSVSHLVGRGVV